MSADAPDGLCRDCFTAVAPGLRYCPNCRGRRILHHPELRTLTIGHLDCDAFYASVEKRDDPSLNDKPVIIGGGKRGVVSTACYIARLSGVRSAMPMFKALKACPHAVVIKPNMAKYVAVSRAIRERMERLTPLVQPLSLDEAFMDLTGTERLHGAPPVVMLARLLREIEQDIGITASVGLSHNKFLAKVASDLDKPRGFCVIGRDETLSFLAAQPVTVIWGVGPAFARSLAKDGLTHLHQIQKRDEADMIRRYGTMGRHVWRLARGLDTRSVAPHDPAKSISAETTFNDDLHKREELRAALWPLCEKVAARAKAKGLAGRVLTVKLKTTEFKTRTRRRSLSAPTQMAHTLFATGAELVAAETDGTAFRLLGIGISELSDADLADPLTLLDEDGPRHSAAERAMDRLRDRFGPDTIGLGRGLGARRR